MSLISLAGELTETGHRLIQRVYYEDTDFSGVVYHARYLHFMERARTDYLRLLGVEQASLAIEGDVEGLVFVVHRMEIDFKAPARMDDVLTIETATEKAGGAKMILQQQIRAASAADRGQGNHRGHQRSGAATASAGGTGNEIPGCASGFRVSGRLIRPSSISSSSATD